MNSGGSNIGVRVSDNNINSMSRVGDIGQGLYN